MSIILLAGFCFVVFVSSWSITKMKTDEEQLSEVTQLATKKFIEDGYVNGTDIEKGKYTDLTVYPLYNDKNEVEFFLIDFAPAGYAYVKSMIKYKYNNGCGRLFVSAGDYIVSYGKPWSRYCRNEIDTGFVDRSNETLYNDSHFKVADIGNERKYLILFKSDKMSGYIPAVKRGDKYLNLISMELYNPDNEYYYEPVIETGFVPNKINYLR